MKIAETKKDKQCKFPYAHLNVCRILNRKIAI